MKRNSKLTILTFFIIVVIFIWIPKGKKPAAVSANTSEQTMPIVTTAAQKKRTEFVDWNRNPFDWPQQQKETGEISNLQVFAIVCENGKSEAMIDESVVRVGDKIADKTVKQIEPDRVILTDGTKDYILKFQD